MAVQQKRLGILALQVLSSLAVMSRRASLDQLTLRTGALCAFRIEHLPRLRRYMHTTMCMSIRHWAKE
jgi:hypothetical protein